MWPFRRKPRHLPHDIAVGTLGPGETAQAQMALPPDIDPLNVLVEADWICSGCNRRLRKRVPLVVAGFYGIEIACPYCSPDELASREVTE